MKSSLLGREIIPFYLWFAALVVSTLMVDAALHLFNLVWIGRYLGIAGVLLIVVSFAHSLRKRKLIRSDNPVRLLRLHERIAWAGSLLVLIHAGIHFNAVLAWVAILAMLVNVASGLTGKYLIQRAQQWLKRARTDLGEAGTSAEDIEARLHGDSLTFALVRRWRTIHVPISIVFAALAIAHIVAVFLFWGWR